MNNALIVIIILTKGKNKKAYRQSGIDSAPQ